MSFTDSGLFYGLTDSVEAIFDDPYARRDFRTEEEEIKAYEELERQSNEYEAKVDRFVPIEWISADTMNSWE